MTDETPLRACTLCGRAARDGDPVLAWEPQIPEFGRHAGQPVHGACLASWPRRDELLRAFFRERCCSLLQHPRRASVFRDDRCAAFVGGDGVPTEVLVLLAGSVHDRSIPIRDWRAQVDSDEVPSSWQPFERDAWRAARVGLVTALPGVKALLERSDRARQARREREEEQDRARRESTESQRQASAAQVERERQRRVLPGLRAKLAAGKLACPSCGAVSGQHRLHGREPPVYLVCAACHRSFDPP